jgi:hypothetical protein
MQLSVAAVYLPKVCPFIWTYAHPDVQVLENATTYSSSLKHSFWATAPCRTGINHHLTEITASIFKASTKILELLWNIYFTLVQTKYAFFCILFSKMLWMKQVSQQTWNWISWQWTLGLCFPLIFLVSIAVNLSPWLQLSYEWRNTNNEQTYKHTKFVI